MSVIRKKPFIEMVIDSLSPAMKDALAGVLNNQPATINRDSSFADMPSNNTVTAVYFKLDETNFKNGILIYNNSYCVLVAYHRFQDLLIYQLNVAAKQYTKINEYLDINELRRVLNDRVGKDIDAGEIDSGTATAGKVLAADGAGGAEWVDSLDTITPETVQAGDAVQLFGFDASGNLVKDNMPEGIVVDQSVIEDSTNAVAGGAVYDELAPIKEDITELQGEMETKANVDGNYPTMTVGVADQLSPYDNESGDDQDEPFSFQATGTGNGTQPDFSTGAIALMKEKQGNSVVVNQLAKALNTTNYYGVNGSLAENSGVLTYTVTTSVGFFDNSIRQDSQDTGNHKLWLYCVLKASANLRCGIAYNGATIYKDCVANAKEIIIGIGQGFTTYPLQVGIETAPQVGDTLEVYDIKVIDLTQWFGSNDNIPSHLLSHPEDFFRYYQGSLAYNTGTLVNSNGRYLKAIGRQQWDEGAKEGYYINPNDGEENAASGFYCSADFIKVNPNSVVHIYKSTSSTHRFFFYNANKEYVGNTAAVAFAEQDIAIPANCCYIKFWVNQAAYGNDVTISIYYDGESDYDQYYPYEVLTNNDTGTETLRSAGSVTDIKKPDGSIVRNVGYVDLSTLSWIKSSSYTNSFFYANLSDRKSGLNDNLICGKYNLFEPSFASTFGENAPDKSICFARDTDSLRVYIRDDSLTGTDTPTGTLFYELATPTTEQGTPYSENLVIDDFGSMDYQGTNGVPQGNLIFYPVDYKAFIDTLYDYTEGTPSNIALKSDLSADKSELQGVDTQLQNAIGGTLRQCLCVKESLDFDNTAFVDLGTLDWVYDESGTYPYMRANGPEDSVTTGNYDVNKILCSSLKSQTAANIRNNGYLGIALDDIKRIRVRTSSMGTNVATFKNAMKGVLLAYEKAEE